MGDLRRERADEVGPGEQSAAVRPVRPASVGGADAVLALQATAGNAAVTRLLQDQEQSWANPSRAVAGDPALVGTIYFKTKERSTDAQDEEVLGLLARAYAPWAMRNAVNSGGERGLHGQVVGYADPRPSIEPDNSTLSGERADIVARRLTRHLIESTHGLIEGDFDIGKVGGGVAAADADLVGGPENLTPLGRLRRAEIYLAGQAMEPESGEKLPEAPVIEPVKVDDGWERWVPALEQGDADTAQGVAGHIFGYLTGMGGNIRDVFENTGRIPLQVKIGPKKKTVGDITYGNHGGTLPFKPVKPPWWDSRTSGHASAGLGRRALDPNAVKHQRLIDKSLMLVSDMRRMNELMDVTIGDPSKAYLMFMTELRKDAPDVAKLKEYAVTVQQLMFVMDAVKAESIEVLQLAGDR